MTKQEAMRRFVAKIASWETFDESELNYMRGGGDTEDEICLNLPNAYKESDRLHNDSDDLERLIHEARRILNGNYSEA